MPLFECSKCKCAENTELSNYWWNVQQEGLLPLCSECDPEIRKWHGEFPKTPAIEVYERDPRAWGYLPKPERSKP